MKTNGFRKAHLFLYKLSDSCFFTPAVLLFISVLSYGLQIDKLGFFWDDWPYLYLNHSQGILGYPQFMSTDRPFSAWLFMLTGFLFKENAFGYHVFILLLRWFNAIAFLWVLNLTWPHNKSYNFIATLFFLVYPGFLQTSIAVIYSLHFSVLFLFSVSMGCMLMSIQDPGDKKWKIVGIICALSIFACEYFAFLEFLRPLLLYYFLRNHLKIKVRMNNLLQIWLPYLIVFCIFFVWRSFIFKFPTYQPELLQKSSVSLITLIFQISNRIFKDFFTVSIAAWASIFSLEKFSIQTNYYPIPWILLSIITFGLSWSSVLNLINRFPPHRNQSNSRWYDDFLVIGIFAFLFAGIPIWVTNLPIHLNFAWDRLTLPFSIGVAFLLPALFCRVIKNKKTQIILISILIGFSVGHHFLNSASFTKEWEMVNDFFWQLHYRIPTLAKGTTILTDDFPLTYYSDNSLTAPLNWMYDEDNHSAELNYMFYFLDVRLGTRFPELKSGLTIEQPYRSFSFTGSTTNTLIIYYSPPSCLHIIDPKIDIYNPVFSGVFKDAFSLSNLDLILPQDNGVPKIFNDQSNSSWCFFYQKADLARQYKDWPSIIAIADQVFASDFRPQSPVEYFPFIEAYANSRQWEKALELSQKIYLSDATKDSMLCALWNRILQSIPMSNTPQYIIDLYFSTFKCGEIL